MHQSLARGVVARLKLHVWLLLLSLFLTACAPTAAPLPPAPAPTPTPVPAPVSLPRDADPHDVLSEWWYVTGHLRSEDGHQFGFEFTIFQGRREATPPGYLAHFAITDVDGQQFSHQARFGQSESQSILPLEVGGWTLARSASETCPYIALTGHSWESYLETLGSHRRANVRRRLRYLADQGARFARALLDRNPDPDEETIREAISGQICRCTGYTTIVRSIQWAARNATPASQR